jgi:hypothetical protein
MWQVKCSLTFNFELSKRCHTIYFHVVPSLARYMNICKGVMQIASLFVISASIQQGHFQNDYSRCMPREPTGFSLINPCLRVLR